MNENYVTIMTFNKINVSKDMLPAMAYIHFFCEYQ